MQGKDLLTSKTAIGTVIAFVGLIAHQLGFDIGDQTDLVETIVTIFGGCYALYGRIKAVQPITSIAGIKVGAK